MNTFKPDPSLKLMDQVRQVLRYHHYAYRTEKTYCDWILRFIHFHNKKHPREMGKSEIEAYLSYLASVKNVATATQSQAMHALLFLYNTVLDLPVQEEFTMIRAKRGPRVPVVLSKGEVTCLLDEMSGIHRIMAGLLYGAGLRLMECIRLRVQDVDFEQQKICVRSGKGGKDRTTFLPQHLVTALKRQIKHVSAIHEKDLAEGFGAVYLPNAAQHNVGGK